MPKQQKGGSVPAPGGGGGGGATGGGDIPPKPAGGLPEGYEWRLEQQGNKWVWVAALAAAAIGYLGQRETNAATARNAANSGGVDVTTWRNPYAGTEGYRQAGLQAAYEALFGPGARPPAGGGSPGPIRPPGPGEVDPHRPFLPSPNLGAQTDPFAGGGKGAEGVGGQGGGPAGGTRGGGVGGAGGGPNNPGQKPPRKPAGGGGGGGQQAPGFAGMSNETAEIRNRLMGLQAQNEGLVGEGSSFVERALAGEETNPLSGRAATAADLIAEDQGLEEYINFLKGGVGAPGGTQAQGGGRGGRGGALVSYGYAGQDGGAAAQQANYGKSATGTDQALKDLVAGKLPAGLADQEEAITRRLNESRAATIRDLRARAVGSGFYGGSVYQDLEEGAIARGDQELAAELAAGRFGAYQNALGLGTQYDLGIADIASKERTAGASASAAAGAAAADLASREKLATLGMWGDALGLGQQGRTAKASALGDLASLTSGDQRAALGSIEGLTGSRRADLSAAGELSLGSDVARNQHAASLNTLAGVRAGVGLGKQQLAFDRERFYDPFARLSAYGDALNSFYGGYGSETTYGRDQRSQSPAPYSSPWGAALTAGAVGGQMAGSFKRRGGA